MAYWRITRRLGLVFSDYEKLDFSGKTAAFFDVDQVGYPAILDALNAC